jgi:2-polyprenyl-3-methyl-5-hydroxy-6-metoxy-1,4-benzoquinol methylase
MRYIYFMNNLIFCAHTDDAIFSLGDYIIDSNDSFTIATAFAGVPTDSLGYKKHTTLRREHNEACSVINAKVINGDLLDDVYGKQNEDDLIDWIKNIIVDFDNIYIPLGIHHPDHIFLSDTLLNLMKHFNKKYFVYAELPYKLSYQDLYETRLKGFTPLYGLTKTNTNFTKNKINAIKKYDSQIKYVSDPSCIDEQLFAQLIVEEEVWEVSILDHAKSFWDKAAKDPDVRYKYIADEWALTETFLNLIENNNNSWNNVLEIGCGIGRLLVPLADKYSECNFYGIDISDEMIKIAPTRNNIKYQELTDNLDLVYSMLVFQHIEHQEKIDYIKLAYEKLKIGGNIFFQFVIGEDNAPYSYQTSKVKISKMLNDAGFNNLIFTDHMHPQWMFVRATK